MTQPNFLILGVAKSGTTSLYHYLCQHPEIFMSRVKEPNFFACEGENLD
ncbi:MAG: sulfotransferase, partial [Cyanobacteria bacterium J06600_6]